MASFTLCSSTILVYIWNTLSSHGSKDIDTLDYSVESLWFLPIHVIMDLTVLLLSHYVWHKEEITQFQVKWRKKQVRTTLLNAADIYSYKTTTFSFPRKNTKECADRSVVLGSWHLRLVVSKKADSHLPRTDSSVTHQSCTLTTSQ